MAGPQDPVGERDSAYQSSPKMDGFPWDCMNTVTHRCRYAFQAMDPVCGTMGLLSMAEFSSF